MIKTIFIFLCILLFAGSYANATTCINSSGTVQNVNFDISTTFTSQENQAGTTKIVHANKGPQMYAICPLGARTNETYRSYITTYPLAEKEGDWQYLKLNQYLEGASVVYDSSAGYFFPPVKYVEMGSDACVSAGCSFQIRESDYTVKLKVIKSFIGQVYIPQTVLFKVYVTTDYGEPLKRVVYTITYSGAVIVPQTCTLNAGQTVTVDLGKIYSQDFTVRGNMPEGYTPRTVQVPVHCTGGVDSMAQLTVRFQAVADRNYPDAIKSDNPDVGVVITDVNGNTIKPNSGLIPFQLKDSEARYSFQVYPVGTTGHLPSEGNFVAQAFMRVDYA